MTDTNPLANHSGYDPNDVGKKGALFGLPFTEEEAKIVILPVPWDATTSYHSGADQGPSAILEASTQLDLEVHGRPAPWRKGIFMAAIDDDIQERSQQLSAIIAPYREALESGEVNEQSDEIILEVNKASNHLNEGVKQKCLSLLSRNKIVGLLGGEHSCPLGYLQALSEKYHDFGVLQIDAHMDLRQAYEGFQYSHASIMYNALQIPNISKLVQVGVRDFCESEQQLVNTSEERIAVFYDRKINKHLLEGGNWSVLCQQIVAQLPQRVYVSFDIDGLQPSLCPGTGTPVPGGLSYEQVDYLLQVLKNSGKSIIGFDLCEVAPQPSDFEWNANVGARILYLLCGLVG